MTSHSDRDADRNNDLIPRRTLLNAVAGTAVAGVASQATTLRGQDKGPAVRHGAIRQSVMGWCFNPMPPEELAQVCKSLGMSAIEGINPKFYPKMKPLGLDISLVASHSFRRGMADRSYHAECAKILRERIDLAADSGYKRVITFTGYQPEGVSFEAATKNCIAGWKSVVGYAEEKGIVLCLEHLNTRDSSHPMKGHPGYFGDDVDHCIDMIKAVDSPGLRLLFDVYHVQVMNGDVIRRIRQYHEYIAHYHTAGVPGRGELDENQEINYPAVMRAILETGYTGYVAQEFIPTWEDKVAALRQAVALCDVAPPAV